MMDFLKRHILTKSFVIYIMSLIILGFIFSDFIPVHATHQEFYKIVGEYGIACGISTIIFYLCQDFSYENKEK